MGIVDDYYGGYENLARFTNSDGECDFEAAYDCQLDEDGFPASGPWNYYSGNNQYKNDSNNAGCHSPRNYEHEEEDTPSPKYQATATKQAGYPIGRGGEEMPQAGGGSGKGEREPRGEVGARAARAVAGAGVKKEKKAVSKRQQRKIERAKKREKKLLLQAGINKAIQGAGVVSGGVKKKITRSRNNVGVRGAVIGELPTSCAERSVLIKGLLPTTQPTEIKEHFRHCGPIVRLSLLREPRTGHRTDLAWMEFGSSKAVGNALRLTGTLLEMNKITVMLKESPEARAEVDTMNFLYRESLFIADPSTRINNNRGPRGGDERAPPPQPQRQRAIVWVKAKEVAQVDAADNLIVNLNK